jgi:hypothetical protein
MVPDITLHVAQVQKKQTKTPGRPVARQLHKPFGDFCILIVQLALITITALLIWKVRQASTLLIPCRATALTAVSLRRDCLELYAQCFLQQVILHAHLGIHSLKLPVLFSQILHLGNKRGTHAAKLGAPSIKTGAAHLMRPTPL